MSLKNNNYFLKGKLIYLRPFELKDIKKSYLTWMNNPNINAGIEARFPISEYEAVKFFENTRKSKDKIVFAICDNKTNKHLGNCMISDLDWINKRCRYGRLIGETKKRKKGIGAEVTRLIQDYVFNKLNFNSLYCAVNINNKASIKSNIKAGMKIEGKSKEAMYFNGKYVDSVNFGITKKEFLKFK